MNQRRFLAVLGLPILALALLVAGCGVRPENNGEGSDNAASIKIAGSDSEVNLVTRLAEEYMKENPQVVISVTGGGSGVGISSLIDGAIDIANSSRLIKDSEIADLKARQGKDIYAVRFAVDGVAVIVHEENRVTELTVDQIGAIYRGDITNWSEVGGENQPITLYGRQSVSGTYIFFRDLVVQGDYSPQKRNLGGNADIVEAVRADKGGIGYVAVGFAKEGDKAAPGLSVLKVSRDAASQAYSPLSLEDVTAGNYPLTRPLYQFVAGKPDGALLEFLRFEVSDAGQAIVLKEGFFPITAADREFNMKALP